MPLKLTEPIVHEYHFDRAGDVGDFASSGESPNFTTAGENGVRLSVQTDGQESFMHFGDKLLYNIDRLCSIEFLTKISSWDSDADGYWGVSSEVNLDPDVIAESAWFKIGTGPNGRNLNVETDDGTNNLAEFTGIEVNDNDWMRLLIDFRTGIQSISPPGKSKAGKGSVQFLASDANGNMIHLFDKFDQHMDMSNYSGGLQPFFGLRQAGSSAASPVIVDVKKIRVVAEAPTG